MTTGMERLSEANNSFVFAELDHRLGRHDGQPHDNCPSCHPDAFTAATPAQDIPTPGGIDWHGFKEPPYPTHGFAWHEPGIGIWMWVRRKREGDLWVNALDPSLSRPGQGILAATEFNPHPEARIYAATVSISDEVLASSAMGVDPAQEAEEQAMAKVIVDCHQQDVVLVSPFWTKVIEEPSYFHTKFIVSAYGRVRPSLAPTEAS